MEKHDKFHPTYAALYEILPDGFSQSCTGFLLCNKVLEVEVDQATIRKDSKYLQEQKIVAYFVGGKQSSLVIANWVGSLQKQVRDWVGTWREVSFKLLVTNLKSSKSS